MSSTACSQKPVVYANYSELRNSGIIDKGWIPDLVPEDARNIAELHDVDSGHTNVEFSYGASSASDIIERLKPVVTLPGRQAVLKFGLPSWSKLKGSNKVSAYLSCNGDSAVVLLDSEKKIAHYLEPVPLDFKRCG